VSHGTASPITAAAASASASRCSSHTIVTTFIDPLASGSRVTSPSVILPGSRPAATAAIPADPSMPSTERPGRSSRTVTIPVPHPTSAIRAARPAAAGSSASIASAAASARASPPLVAS
jgi:hypothetical protein